VTHVRHYQKLFSSQGGGSRDIVRDRDRVGGGWVRNAQYRRSGVEGGPNRNAKDLACQLMGQAAGSLGSFWDCFGRNRWWEREILFENVGGWSERICNLDLLRLTLQAIRAPPRRTTPMGFPSLLSAKRNNRTKEIVQQRRKQVFTT
jgi:hypothetical protein